MPKPRILVQWIGHSDFRGLASTLPPARRDTILERLGRDGGSDTKGPTKTLLSNHAFDEVHLLSNYDRQWNRWFQQWLVDPVTIHQVELSQPTDYAAIFTIANDLLGRIKQKPESASKELCLHLSPGTPAMAAVWLLLGKTRYPATFFETSRDGRVWISTIPFELLDVIPEVLKNPDSYFQHLASEAPSQIEGFEDIAGDSRAIREAVGRAKRVSMRSLSVLLLGESGTGKDLFAQAIHKASPRRNKPFKAINCAALSKTLLESELFGHSRGAYTGADRDRRGAFELVDGGTLFLDEIGECDIETQAKLLRVLQPVHGEGPAIRKVCRLGDENERKLDVRIVAATNRDLVESVQKNEFRADLYYRLAAVTITLPPLRNRPGDTPKIAEHLLAQINRQFAAEEPQFEHKSLSPSAIAFVKSFHWPGNVRQLQNALVQAAVLSDGTRIGRKELEAGIGEAGRNSAISMVTECPLGDGFDLEKYLLEIHRAFLIRAMREAKGVKSHAAKLLGIDNYQTLAAQLKRLKVPDQD